jgi:hypothetical protein
VRLLANRSPVAADLHVRPSAFPMKDLCDGAWDPI